MGIHNFCKLLQSFAPPSNSPDFFDSILVDAQSFLYIAIEQAVDFEEEAAFIPEISTLVWQQLKQTLNFLFSFENAVHPDRVTLVLSFDGISVPMKYPTQCERRSKKTKVDPKSFYRYVLFGSNIISETIQSYLIHQLKHYKFQSTRSLRVVMVGCSVPGEGEHKIFHITEKKFPCCQHPIIVSVDQDLFVLSFIRLKRYKTLQIYRYNQFYHITNVTLPFPLQRFITVSFLFGNDFIKTLVAISPTNTASILNAMVLDQTREDPPAIFSQFLHNMKNCIRYSVTQHVNRLMIVSFWVTYFWMMDYYSQRDFPQKYIKNPIYDIFDRNQLITALLDETFSRETFHEAQDSYKRVRSQCPPSNPEQYVFTNSEVLKQLEPYWLKLGSESYTVFQITKKVPKKELLKRSRDFESESFLKKKAATETARILQKPPSDNPIADPTELIDEPNQVPKSAAVHDQTQ